MSLAQRLAPHGLLDVAQEIATSEKLDVEQLSNFAPARERLELALISRGWHPVAAARIIGKPSAVVTPEPEPEHEPSPEKAPRTRRPTSRRDRPRQVTKPREEPTEPDDEPVEEEPAEDADEEPEAKAPTRTERWRNADGFWAPLMEFVERNGGEEKYVRGRNTRKAVGAARPMGISFNRATAAERKAAEASKSKRQLPLLRADCENGERPCPFVTCRHHLALDVIGDSIKTPYPDYVSEEDPRLEELPYTCSLDVAERTQGASLEQVGALLNVTREWVRQMEASAFKKLKRSGSLKLLRDYIMGS